MKNKINKKIIFKYIALFFISIILSNAKIGNLNPFLYAFFFASLFVGLNEKTMSAITLASEILVSQNLQSLFSALTVVAVGLIVFYLHKLIKRNLRLWVVFFSYLISLVTFVYYNLNNWQFIVYYIVLGLISLFVFIVVLQVSILRGNCFKLTLDESVCFLFFLATLGVGLANVYILNFSIFRLLLALSIFVCVACSTPSFTFVIILSFSFGAAIGCGSLNVVAEFAVLAMFASMFAMPNKIKIVLIAVFGDVFLQLVFFNTSYTLFWGVLPIVFAGIIFILLPKKLISELSDLIYVKKSELSTRSIINTTRKNLRKRMAELSNIFLEMKQLHLNMVKKELTKDELIGMLMREVTGTCCKDCLDKNRCTRSIGTDNKSNLELMLNIAVNKGKLTLLDVPSSLTNRCVKINNLIALINRLTSEYRQYRAMMADVNNVKILLADQMGAVSRLLLDLGDEIDTNVNFDIAKENKIIAKLLAHNVYCKEVLIYSEKNEDITTEVIVNGANQFNENIEKVVSDVLKCNMNIVKTLPLEEADYSSVTLKKKAKYDCAFGLSSCTKSGEINCGDCHSIIRLNKNKFLLALCDGMGSGNSANIMSARTLSLIENFYKVGFDNEIILESVNKLLAVNNQENYATLDVCLLDLDKETADFIKVGAPFGVVKRERNIEKIEGGALPIGALDSISPAIYKTTISVKDIVIMATDGITDAFENEENFIDFVSKLATNNPQSLADSILNEALRLNGMSAKDDMTVLVARTYLKN